MIPCPICGVTDAPLYMEPYRICPCGKTILISNHGAYMSVDGFDPSPWLDEYSEITRARECGNGVFIDVGANRGQYSLLLRNQFRKIISIEPEPENYETLVAVTRQYPHISPIRAAVSNVEGPAWLRLDRSCWRHELCTNDYAGRKVLVNMIRLDSLITEPVDLIKVDVEGHELGVLEGASNCKFPVKHWLVECHTAYAEIKASEHLEDTYEVTRTSPQHLYATLK